MSQSQAEADAIKSLRDAAQAVALFRTKSKRIGRAAVGRIMKALECATDECKQVMLVSHGRTSEAAERRAAERDENGRMLICAGLRLQGLSFPEIGKRIGVSAKRARDLAAGARD